MANENIRKSYGGAAAATVLVGTITDASTTLNALDASSYPDGSAGPFVIRLDGGQSNEEKVLISGRAGNVLTAVERGYDGTAAVAHSDVAVTHCLDSHSIDQANQMANVGTAGVGDVLPLWNGTTWESVSLAALTTPIFATVTARDAALTSPVNGTFAYTTTTPANTLWKHNGSAWKAQDGSWTTFTPSWLNFTLGNGTNDYFKYRYIGGNMQISGQLTYGSTSNLYGNLAMTFPDSFSTNPETYQARSSNVTIYDQSGTDYFYAWGWPNTTTMAFYQIFPSSASSPFASPIEDRYPMTWAAGDTLQVAALINGPDAT
jgi:hypothetical protein